MPLWASYHLWHEKIPFLRLNIFDLVHEHLQTHNSVVGVFHFLMILISAAVKSAQLQFSPWLLRVMAVFDALEVFESNIDLNLFHRYSHVHLKN